MKIKKNLKYTIPAAALLFALLFLNAYSSAVGMQASPARPGGGIRLRVFGNADGKPLHNAEVYILESGATFYTDNNGHTPVIDIPVLPDARYAETVPKKTGDATILIKKDGYAPCILLHVVIKENETRQNVAVPMLTNTETSEPYITLSETPDKEWLEDILKYSEKTRKNN